MALDRPQRLAVATIGPGARQNQVAHHAQLQIVPGAAENMGIQRPIGRRVGNELRQGLGFDRGHGFGTVLLADGLFGGLELAVIFGLQAFERVVGRGHFVLLLYDADLREQLVLQIANLPDDTMALFDCRQHSIFGQLTGETLDHQDRVFAARHDQVEIAVLKVVLRRERNELAVDLA